MNVSDITLEQVQDFFLFLQGQSPDPMIVPSIGNNFPALTPDAAFGVIFYLQEAKILPEWVDRCFSCGVLFDSRTEGLFTDSSELDKMHKDGYYPFPGQMNRLFCGHCTSEIPEWPHHDGG